MRSRCGRLGSGLLNRKFSVLCFMCYVRNKRLSLRGACDEKIFSGGVNLFDEIAALCSQ